MAAVIDHRDSHRPFIFRGMPLCSGQNRLDIGKTQYGFGFHVFPYANDQYDYEGDSHAAGAAYRLACAAILVKSNLGLPPGLPPCDNSILVAKLLYVYMAIR